VEDASYVNDHAPRRFRTGFARSMPRPGLGLGQQFSRS
jgi:hypothetical protein